MSFVFTPYYQFPKEFALETGYPMKKISEDNVARDEACGGQQIQVYVVDPDD
jgi:hypothetical protein